MKQFIKMAVLGGMLLAAGIFTGGCGNQNVGVLDMSKVMTDSPKVKQYQEQFNAKAKELSDQLTKDKASLKPEEFPKRQEDVYGQLAKVKQDLEGQIETNVKQTLEQVAKEKNMSIILYKNGVAQGGTDITDEVIKKMQ